MLQNCKWKTQNKIIIMTNNNTKANDTNAQAIGINDINVIS